MAAESQIDTEAIAVPIVKTRDMGLTTEDGCVAIASAVIGEVARLGGAPITPERGTALTRWWRANPAQMPMALRFEAGTFASLAALGEAITAADEGSTLYFRVPWDFVVAL